jgi:hypothetical protein
MELLGLLATIALVLVGLVAVGVFIMVLVMFANGFNH